MSRLIAILIMMMPLLSWGAEVGDIYVQKNGKILGFEEAIVSMGGSVVLKSNSEYYVNIRDHRYIVDFSSPISVKVMMGIFLNTIYVELSMMHVRPRKNIYFDDKYVSLTDENGNANKIFYLEEAGSHAIELKDMNNQVVDDSSVHIDSKAIVKCVGIDKMHCEVQESK